MLRKPDIAILGMTGAGVLIMEIADFFLLPHYNMIDDISLSVFLIVLATRQ